MTTKLRLLAAILFCLFLSPFTVQGQEEPDSSQEVEHKQFSAAGMKVDLEHQLDTVQSIYQRCILLNDYAYLLKMMGDRQAAMVLVDSAYAIATRLNYTDGICRAHENYSGLFRTDGDFEKALYHGREQFKILKSTDIDSITTGSMLSYLGNVQLEYGLYYNALDTMKLALDILQKHGASQNISTCLNAISIVYLELGQKAEGHLYQDRAIATLRDAGGSRDLTIQLLNKAVWLMYEGRFEESKKYIEEANDFADENDFDEHMGHVFSRRGELEALQGVHSKAIVFYRKAHEEFGRIGETVEFMRNLLYMTESFRALGQTKDALATAELLAGMLEKMQSQQSRSEVHLLLSKLYNEDGEPQAAMKQMDLYLKAKEAADSLAQMKQARNLEARFRNGQQKIALLEKDKELVHQADEIVRKNNRLKLLGFGTLALALLSALIVVAYRQRIKSQAQKTEIQLNQALIESTEEERERIARELHDGTGSLLTGIKLGLEYLQEKIAEPEQAQQLSTTIYQVQTVAKEVRRVSHAMAPTAIERLPFEEVVTDLINAFSHIGKAEIDYSSSGDFEQMNKTERLMLYRIMQECLNNSFKHADASEINISLMATEGEIEMLYQDNGKGYDPSKTAPGLGLSSIEKRIHYLHGKQTLETESGSGMLLILNFPILRA